MTESLIRRRDAIGRAYLAKPLQLDEFRIVEGRVVYEDLGVKHGFLKPLTYSHDWYEFDNASREKRRIAGAAGTSVPKSSASFLALDITAGDTPGNQRPKVTVYLKQASGRLTLVGIDRASN
jgi:hypothetical protein